MMEQRELNEAATDALAPLGRWSKECHGASLALVRAGLAFRVARGWVPNIDQPAWTLAAGIGQHSWAVVGEDCYDPEGVIIDPTLWSYCDMDPAVRVCTLAESGYLPHGGGSIWDYGQPGTAGGPIVELTPSQPLSYDAKRFLEILGPLDRVGWYQLANAPVHDWPAAEILSAIDDTEGLAAFVPVDHLGMITRRNPGGLYLRSDAAD